MVKSPVFTLHIYKNGENIYTVIGFAVFYVLIKKDFTYFLYN